MQILFSKFKIISCSGDKDDILRYAERILGRAMTVEVAVRTDRDPQQEEALHQVNIQVEILIARKIIL